MFLLIRTLNFYSVDQCKLTAGLLCDGRLCHLRCCSCSTG